MSFKPEVLAPAGSLDKLKAAIAYGADAVYLAGQKFGLRTAADNFTPNELDEGISFAHERGAKAYCVLNAFPHDKDIQELPEFLGLLQELKIDAVIASDIGVISLVKKHTSIPIHLSTQASCLNEESVRVWKNLGAKRVIFGREVSIQDAGQIKKNLDIEVELFIHGSMCMAYSGHCTISNFTKGRDSNRGGCAQSCRFPYQLDYKDQDGILRKSQTYFMSSKDLNGLDLVQDFFEHQIDSVKIEGRMRSPLYAAMSARAYKLAVNEYFKTGQLSDSKIVELAQELNLVPHREYFSGNLDSPAGPDSVLNAGNFNDKLNFIFLGTFQNNLSNLIVVKMAFDKGDEIEWVRYNGQVVVCHVALVQDVFKNSVDRAKINTLARLELVDSDGNRVDHTSINEGEILRKRPMISKIQATDFKSRAQAAQL